MLAIRVIPTILMDKGNLIKGEKFKADRIVGNALQAAKIYAMRGVDELMLLDVTATKEGREPDYEMVKKLADGCFAPLTVGGGIKTEEHVRKLLQSGADKVCLCSIIDDNLRIIKELSDKFGSQCITVSLNCPGKYINHPWIKDYAKEIENHGAGEILLQSVPRDGTMRDYDIELVEAVSNVVSVPVIASGGCSGYEDMYNAIQAGASAVAAGALFQFTEATPKGARDYLAERGVNVR